MIHSADGVILNHLPFEMGREYLTSVMLLSAFAAFAETPKMMGRI
jgi:hypothetical protein